MYAIFSAQNIRQTKTPSSQNETNIAYVTEICLTETALAAGIRGGAKPPKFFA